MKYAENDFPENIILISISGYIQIKSQMFSKFSTEDLSPKSPLNKYFRTHTDEKSFVCEVCMKRFSSKASLNRHLQLHTDEKPHIRKLCTKGFPNKDHLNIHLLTHAQVKSLMYVNYAIKDFHLQVA